MDRIDSFVACDGLQLHVRIWGQGETTVLFIHGNLACADWFDLIGPRLPADLRVVAIDWRGCGASDKPPATANFANYSIVKHARDHLAALDALSIQHCHLATHSTGGLIGMHMLLAQPSRFGKVLGLSPVGPGGLCFPPESAALLTAMKAQREQTAKGLALVAPTLFRPETLVPGVTPVFADHATKEQRTLFDHLVDQTFHVSDGIWFGTARHLNHAWETGGLRNRQTEVPHQHRILWGKLDAFIPLQDMEAMVAEMPDCRLTIEPSVGHAMLIERPDIYAARFAEFF